MEIKVRVPGSCGELVQGTLCKEPFLVTCPIDMYTTVCAKTGSGKNHGLGRKALAAKRKALEYLRQKEYPYDLFLSSDLPRGKGMASSSADIAAVILAVAASLGKYISPRQIAKIAAAIEPTDGIFYHGIVCLNLMTGKVYETFHHMPPLYILIFDHGGTVNTMAFHQQRMDLPEQFADAEKWALALALVKKKDPVSLGQAATLSARLHQQILPKENLEEILMLALACGAVGINAAHSGTVIGLLFAPDAARENRQQAIQKMQQAFPNWQYLREARLIAGGYQIKKNRRL